jgi:hypothetical protein
LSFRDDAGRHYAHLRMDDDAPCFIDLSGTGVIVKRSKWGLFGAIIYREPNGFAAAMTAKALYYLYPYERIPDDIGNPMLRAFVNAAMHSSTLTDLVEVFKGAIREAEWASGTAIDKLARGHLFPVRE